MFTAVAGDMTFIYQRSSVSWLRQELLKYKNISRFGALTLNKLGFAIKEEGNEFINWKKWVPKYHCMASSGSNKIYDLFAHR